MQPVVGAPAFMMLQSWRVPPELARVQDYANAVRGRGSWAGTSPPVEDIVSHWCARMRALRCILFIVRIMFVCACQV
jgi:hypothetical protein